MITVTSHPEVAEEVRLRHKMGEVIKLRNVKIRQVCSTAEKELAVFQQQLHEWGKKREAKWGGKVPDPANCGKLARVLPPWGKSYTKVKENGEVRLPVVVLDYLNEEERKERPWLIGYGVKGSVRSSGVMTYGAYCEAHWGVEPFQIVEVLKDTDPLVKRYKRQQAKAALLGEGGVR